MKLRAAGLLGALAIGVPLVVWICGRWSAPSPAQLALEAEQRVLRALNEKTAVEAHQVPLGELLERLAIRHGVEIEIAEPSLIGNAAREPVSLILSGVSLRAALSWILGQLDLDFFCRDGKILVTTDASNREDPANLVARVYPLLAAPAGWRSSGDEAQNLLAGSLERIVAEDDGPSLNESGELFALPNALVAVQLPHVQERIEFLLGQMASVGARRDTCAPIQLSATDNSPAELDLRARLAQRAHVEFFRASLDDACRFLAADFGLPIVLDRRAMREADTGASLPITINVRDIPLGTALTQMLAPLNLDWEIRQELLVVAPPPERKAWKSTPRLYPIGDLAGHRPGQGGEELCAALQTVLDLWVHTDYSAETVGENLLLVDAHPTIHAEVTRLLNRLREFLVTCDSTDGSPSAAQRLRAVLQEPARLVFDKTPLADVAAQIGRQYALDMRLDEAVFSDPKYDPQASVTCDLVDETLDAALQRMLAPWDLTVQQRDDVLWITADWAVAYWESTELYDVRPLIDPDHGLMDRYQLEALIRGHVKEMARGYTAVNLFGEILIVRALEPTQRTMAQMLASLETNLDRLPTASEIADRPADLTARQVLEPVQLAEDPGAILYTEFVLQSCRPREE